MLFYVFLFLLSCVLYNFFRTVKALKRAVVRKTSWILSKSISICSPSFVFLYFHLKPQETLSLRKLMRLKGASNFLETTLTIFSMLTIRKIYLTTYIFVKKYKSEPSFSQCMKRKEAVRTYSYSSIHSVLFSTS